VDWFADTGTGKGYESIKSWYGLSVNGFSFSFLFSHIEERLELLEVLQQKREFLEDLVIKVSFSLNRFCC
jgi:hypothetical protein